MKIIKFEGEIFETIIGYEKAINIIKEKYSESGIAVVIPVDTNTEKTLVSIALLASKKDERHEEELQTLETLFLNHTRTLVPINEQSAALSFIKKQFN